MNFGQEFLIGAAGLCFCVWALIAFERFMTRGIRASCTSLGAILLLIGFVFMYR